MRDLWRMKRPLKRKWWFSLKLCYKKPILILESRICFLITSLPVFLRIKTYLLPLFPPKTRFIKMYFPLKEIKPLALMVSRSYSFISIRILLGRIFVMGLRNFLVPRISLKRLMVPSWHLFLKSQGLIVWTF